MLRPSPGVNIDENRMAQGPEQLVVRQHERYHCRLGATVRVADISVDQVALARSVGDGAGVVKATVVDCSRGGMGLETTVFFPRGCRLRVHLGGADSLVELSVRVQRASMLDRTPTYYLGVSFVGSGDVHATNVDATLAMARADGRAAPSKGAA
jgi:hypothetical protein